MISAIVRSVARIKAMPGSIEGSERRELRFMFAPFKSVFPIPAAPAGEGGQGREARWPRRPKGPGARAVKAEAEAGMKGNWQL